MTNEPKLKVGDRFLKNDKWFVIIEHPILRKEGWIYTAIDALHTPLLLISESQIVETKCRVRKTRAPIITPMLTPGLRLQQKPSATSIGSWCKRQWIRRR